MNFSSGLRRAIGICAGWRVLLLLAAMPGGGLRAGGPAPADDFLPKPPPPSKYDLMAARSPFSPPTAGPATHATPPPPPAPAWSDSFTVKGVMQHGNAYVAVLEDANNLQHHMTIRSDREDAESHLTLTGVKWVNKADPPTVTVRRGTAEFAQLKYEPNVAGGGAPSAGGGPALPGMPRAPLVNSNGAGVPGMPSSAMVRPPPGGVNGAAVMPGGAPNNLNLPRGAVIRRPIIQANPAPAAARGAVSRPLPGKAGTGDDDDDDD